MSLHTRFTRGWTLQELIAPREIQFYDAKWNSIGLKKDLVDDLSTITGIGAEILMHEQSLDLVSVAARMSWAAKRETTRTEDMAYCLLGIFDVNLPLLYGEAEKAFQRLQEEIIRSKADLSIFAWQCIKPPRVDRWTLTGVLARSPQEFSNGHTVGRMYRRETHDFSITNVGIKTRLRNLWAPDYGYVMQLNSYSGLTGKYLALRLRKIGPEMYLREGPYDLLEYATGAFSERRPVERYLLTTIPVIPRFSERLDPSARFQHAGKLLRFMRRSPVRVKLPSTFKLMKIWPADRWDEEDRLFFVSGDSRWDTFQLDLEYELSHKAKQADGTLIGKTTTLEFTLYALGWSHIQLDSIDRASFGLVSRLEYATSIDKISRWILEDEPTTATISKWLGAARIPRHQWIRYDIPQTDHSLVIKIESTLHNVVTLTAEEIPSIDVLERITEDWPIFRDY
ncbi:uncharacterized protein J4E87_006738 [Alternaria ethzedia]|uniref:uncharacterized protein n=1 Tax=Alternaria ethzedia TaxID=181014 RepID=UPI0020C561BE|nr:uncharacterized protein J4E87_006738 [Alternaria ethzedia]KAI4621110.1 hypothetical protein J4E87_006738 [Alternaria ethzedia]